MKAGHRRDVAATDARVDVLVVHRRLACRAAERLDEALHAGDAVRHVADLALLGEGEAANRPAPHRVEGVPAEQQVVQPMLDGVAREKGGPGLLRELDGSVEQCHGLADGACPDHGFLERDIGSRREREMTAFLRDGDGGPCEAFAVGMAAEDGAEARTEPRAAIDGRFRHAMCEARPDQADRDRLMEIGVDEIRCQPKPHHDAHGGRHVGIVHGRQVDQLFDPALAEGPVQALEIGLHVRGRRVRGDGLIEHPQALDAGPSHLIELPSHHLQGHLLDDGPGAVDLGSALAQHLVDEGFRLVEATAADLAFGLFHVQGQRQLMGVLPAAGVERRHSLRQIVTAGFVGRGSLRLAGGLQVETRDPGSFLHVRRRCQAPVELTRDIEDLLGHHVARHGLRQRQADAQMHRATSVFRNERVGTLLDAIVEELVAPVGRDDDARLEGRFEAGMHGRLGWTQRPQRSEVRLPAEARQDLQRLLGLARKPQQSAHHESQEIVRVALRGDATDVPVPLHGRGLELQEPLLLQAGQELSGEERVASCLFMDKPGEGACPMRIELERVADEQIDLADAQGAEFQLLDGPSVRPDRRDHLVERVVGLDLAGPVGADQVEVVRPWIDGDGLHERERRRIQPLQVVEEDDERMAFTRERSDESLERRVEALRGLGGIECRQRRLRADEGREFGKELEQQPAVASDGFVDLLSPAREFDGVAVQDLTDQSAQRVGKRRAGRVAQGLVELAGDEDAMGLDDVPARLVNDGGFADSRIARNEREFQLAGRRHAVEGVEQHRRLVRTAIDLLRNHQPARHVLCAEAEVGDPGAVLPLLPAATQVGPQARGRLVAILAHLLEQLHHDGRQRGGDRRLPIRQRRRLPGDVTMDPLERIYRDEGQRSRQHLVEQDAQRIEVAARVHRAVHAPGLFRRHVGERALDHFRRAGRLAFARIPRGEGEAGQPG